MSSFCPPKKIVAAPGQSPDWARQKIRAAGSGVMPGAVVMRLQTLPSPPRSSDMSNSRRKVAALSGPAPISSTRAEGSAPSAIS